MKAANDNKKLLRVARRSLRKIYKYSLMTRLEIEVGNPVPAREHAFTIQKIAELCLARTKP